LVSPLDWAIMEAWQKAGVPLEAALKGIDNAFESYQRSRRGAGKPLKNLAYCTDAVLEAAEEQQAAAAGSMPKNERATAREAFSRHEVRAYFAKNVAHLKIRLRKTIAATAGDRSAAEGDCGISELQYGAARYSGDAGPGRCGAAADDLDEKLHALLSHAPEELMLKIQREVDGQLSTYRRKMKAQQLAMVEKQYMQKRLLEEFGIPRLSLST